MNRKEYGCPLPNGTRRFEPTREYHLSNRSFRMDEKFRILHPNFNWVRHIEDTMHNCLSGTIRRFMKVT